MAGRVNYDCTKCPAYCCSIYGRVEVNKRDIARLAKHFGLSIKEATEKFTIGEDGDRTLRRKKDPIFGQACKFLDPVTRGCTIYEGRPTVCRQYPGRSNCSYYDVIEFEREVQRDRDILPVVRLIWRKQQNAG